METDRWMLGELRLGATLSREPGHRKERRLRIDLAVGLAPLTSDAEAREAAPGPPGERA